MNPRRAAWLLAVLMCLASLAGVAVLPGKAVAPKAPEFVLEEMVPKVFSDWRLEQSPVAQVVNPQAQEMLDRIYSQILTRTYINKQGYRIMLSMAYGDDQRGGLQAHKPEVCYPAQGFTLTGNVAAQITTDLGPIPTRRLTTNLGSRYEPITYWFNIGGRPIENRLQKRWAELRLLLTGNTPDGLLIRVSSIDTDQVRAFSMQDDFVRDLIVTVPPAARTRLSGL